MILPKKKNKTATTTNPTTQLYQFILLSLKIGAEIAAGSTLL
jgi:hypothetical protein